MKCTLCDEEISNYHPEFNHFEIDEKHSIEICKNCLDKLIKWQQKIYTKLFPTKVLKKRFGKEKGNMQ